MAQSAVAGNPVEAVRQWLLREWRGGLRPNDVKALHGEDAEGRDAWYFVLVLPDPEGETWNPDDFADLRRGVRDKALEVGLEYPWYVLPRTERDDPVEDESDLPDETI